MKMEMESRNANHGFRYVLAVNHGFKGVLAVGKWK